MPRHECSTRRSRPCRAGFRTVRTPIRVRTAAIPCTRARSRGRVWNSDRTCPLGRGCDHTPFRLVGELVHEAAPPVAEYGTVHRALARLAAAYAFSVLLRLPHHVPYHQGLHADELVLFYQPVGQLVLEVIAVAAELGIRLGHDRPLSAVVVRPCRSTGQLALLPFDILLQSAQPVRIVDLLAGGQREEIFDAQVDADPPLGSCFRLDVHVEQEHETVRPVLTFHRPAGQALDRMA